jgi:hypothetical protein
MNPNVLDFPAKLEGQSVLEYAGDQENIHEGTTLQLDVKEICAE